MNDSDHSLNRAAVRNKVLYYIISSLLFNNSLPPLFSLANIVTASSTEATIKTAIVICDIIIIALVWIKTFGIRRTSLRIGMRTSLATFLLRDGTPPPHLSFSPCLLYSSSLSSSQAHLLTTMNPYRENRVVISLYLDLADSPCMSLFILQD